MATYVPLNALYRIYISEYSACGKKSQTDSVIIEGTGR